MIQYLTWLLMFKMHIFCNICIDEYTLYIHLKSNELEREKLFIFYSGFGKAKEKLFVFYSDSGRVNLSYWKQTWIWVIRTCMNCIVYVLNLFLDLGAQMCCYFRGRSWECKKSIFSCHKLPHIQFTALSHQGEIIVLPKTFACYPKNDSGYIVDSTISTKFWLWKWFFYPKILKKVLTTFLQ